MRRPLQSRNCTTNVWQTVRNVPWLSSSSDQVCDLVSTGTDHTCGQGRCHCFKVANHCLQNGLMIETSTVTFFQSCIFHSLLSDLLKSLFLTPLYTYISYLCRLRAVFVNQVGGSRNTYALILLTCYFRSPHFWWALAACLLSFCAIWFRGCFCSLPPSGSVAEPVWQSAQHQNGIAVCRQCADVIQVIVQ